MILKTIGIFHSIRRERAGDRAQMYFKDAILAGIQPDILIHYIFRNKLPDRNNLILTNHDLDLAVNILIQSQPLKSKIAFAGVRCPALRGADIRRRSVQQHIQRLNSVRISYCLHHLVVEKPPIVLRISILPVSLHHTCGRGQTF